MKGLAAQWRGGDGVTPPDPAAVALPPNLSLVGSNK